MLQQGGLVVYKGRPARIAAVDAKLHIELADGGERRVRPKDVLGLHPGPLSNLAEVSPRTGDVQTVWELLAGETATIRELAELLFDEDTPSAAWAAWELLDEGVYFRGTPDALTSCTEEEVAAALASRQARAEKRQAEAAFVERVKAGQLGPDDGPLLEPVQALAMGSGAAGGLLKTLGRGETPENAHALLLELGHWDETVVPYPSRLGLALSPPEAQVAELPDDDRVDLTHLLAFAIDDEGSTDPDDALSFEGNRLYVHVADAAALVQPDSDADMVARGRGANLYLPDTTAHMLPSQVTDRLGLGLSEVSPALTIAMDATEDGQILAVEVLSSLIRAERLTYEQAESRLEHEPFASLDRLARASHERRMAAGAVDIVLPEVKVTVTDGQVHVLPMAPLRSRALVAEAMILAGQAAAQFAVSSDFAMPFSTQDPPDDADELPEGAAGMYALRRRMRPRQHRTAAGRHAGLGVDAYVQVTSPLRRYHDLVAHQQLRAHIQGEPIMPAQELLARIAAAQQVCRNVRKAERSSNQHWTLVYLMQHPGWEGEGIVVERRGPRSRLLLPSLGLEADAHLRDEAPLNATVRVQVREVVLPSLTVNLAVVA